MTEAQNPIPVDGKRRPPFVWAVAALLLLAPLVAMQFNDEFNWSIGDFAIAGALILGAGVTFTRMRNVSNDLSYRLGLGVAIGAAVIQVWVNAGVGIIGSADNDANLMYFGVLALGVIGTVVSRFQPEPFAKVLIGVAAGQVLVAAIAIVGDLGTDGTIWPWDLVGLTGFFTTMWIGSAFLLRNAAGH